MHGKKPPTIKPSEFSNDLIVRTKKILAEAREGLCLEEERQTNIEKQNREYLAQIDKDSEERRKQSREFNAALHKSVMGILSSGDETRPTDSAKELRRSSAQAEPRNKGGRPKGKGNEELRKRNEFIVAKKRLALKSPQICRELDVAGFATPEGWPSTWVESYRKDAYRERIYSIFADAVKRFG